MPYHRSKPTVVMGNATRECGAALVIAMLVFAISTALVVAIKSEFTRYFARSANVLLAEQGQAYLRGGEQLAAMVLIGDYDADKLAGRARDDLTEAWAQQQPPFALDEGGWLSGTLEDLQGRFNLNSLAVKAQRGTGSATRKFTPAQKQFIRLLQALEEPPISEQEAIQITESVHDWLDADEQVSSDGAEDDFYYARDPAHRTANRPMSSPSELLAVANITPEIYRALQPWVTVWPEDDDSKLNIHTAPSMLLRTLNADNNLSPLSELDGEALAEHRDETGFVDINDFFDNPVFDGFDDKMTESRGLVDEKTAYFLLRAEVEVAERNMRLYSVLKREFRKVDTVARAAGSL